MKKPLAILLLFLHILPSIPFAQQTETVAVIEFEGNGISQTEAKSLTNRLRNELVSLDEYTVIERGKMEEILKEQAFQQTGCTSDECAVEVGKLLSVQKIVIGSIDRVGSVFSVSARIVDVESGQIVKSATYDHKGRIGDLLTVGMNEVARKLLGLSVLSEIMDRNSVVTDFSFNSPKEYQPSRSSRLTTNTTTTVKRPPSGQGIQFNLLNVTKAMLWLDGKYWGNLGKGGSGRQIFVPTTAGTHSYRIDETGYEIQKADVVVRDDEYILIPVRLYTKEITPPKESWWDVINNDPLLGGTLGLLLVVAIMYISSGGHLYVSPPSP